MGKVAILVDGGFYRKQANWVFGEKSPSDRADELIEYCHRHLKQERFKNDPNPYKELYRIFYYDCPPSDKTVYNPLSEKVIYLKESKQYEWSNKFFKELSKKRKVALRMGEILESQVGYIIKPEIMTKLCKKEMSIDSLKLSDFHLDIQQKGVDMRIGLDIASLANKRLVDQIILIAGDSDFVPAAKHARREGIDFILDPMWHTCKDNLRLHIDGLNQKTNKPPYNEDDPLCVQKYYKEHIQEQ